MVPEPQESIEAKNTLEPNKRDQAQVTQNFNTPQQESDFSLSPME
jgi:hypothetical protein